MAWIDFKSGFALVGSLVVLAGSLDSRMRKRNEEPADPENPRDQPKPETPRDSGEPQVVSAPTVNVAMERAVSLLKVLKLLPTRISGKH